ncbi:MAG: CPBP family intramembrane metalloprotease [Flavobacteriales bacterium]|jgi:membrane protease YdiL (CAAX protease family)|nr:CPBP family intramembrane metalloprotease [Flavobacteriales bacterium]
MTKKKLLILGLVTLLGFTAIAFIIHYFTVESSFFSLFKSDYNMLLQIGVGAIYGTAVALIGWRVMQLPLLKPELAKYTAIFNGETLNFFTITFISLCAGIGEEIFFRGILQGYLGILLTSILFVAIHGYLNPKNWRISIYGLYMTLVIIGIGVMSNKLGLTAAITAHALIDFVLLYQTKNSYSPS